MNDTINGLHSCKPGNDPVVNQIKTFTVEHRPAKDGKKAWIKIKAAPEDKGGEPYRIVSVEPTDYVDDYGNISFNLEIESVRKVPVNAPESLPASQSEHDGVIATRKHLMQSANLLVLCIRAVEKTVAPHQPLVAQTSEQFQSDVAKLYIEASSRRTNDGVHWWSYIDRMPDTPLK